MTGQEIPPIICVIVPCYDEQEIFPASDTRLKTLLEHMKREGLVNEGSFILYVDDGSLDSTWKLIEKSHGETPDYVRGLKLAHNSGHQNALLAGLEYAGNLCDAAVTIDADLQDDIEAIPKMVEEFREGAEIVYGVRRKRENESWVKRNSAVAFYKTMRWLGVETVFNHADFRLMSSRAIHELMRYGEANIFLRGVIPQIGLRKAEVSYDRIPRLAGKSKYPLKKMFGFAVQGITSFSIRPVRMVFFLGMIFVCIALFILIYTLIRYFNGDTIEGWTSLILSIWFCTGMILVALGIIGEYIGKIFIEVKKRPRYIIETLLKNG